MKKRTLNDVIRQKISQNVNEKIYKVARRFAKRRKKNYRRIAGLTYNNESTVNVVGNSLSAHFLMRNKLVRELKPKFDFRVPSNFCIHSDPDSCLAWLGATAHSLTYKKNKYFYINHHKVNKWSLASEVLLAIIVSELKEYRASRQVDTTIEGKYSENPEHKVVLDQIGVLAGLAPVNNFAKNVIIFSRDCKYAESSSSSAQDLKTETSKSFVQHIKHVLASHKLNLLEKAALDLMGCLGEVLDNASEHCGLTAPTWFVRGYIDNNSKDKNLELMIMNVGKSIAETFLDLDDNHNAKLDVMKYVSLHRRHDFTNEELITVAALQGSVSSKRDTEDSTRGQGTVTLIETFEGLYNEYQNLRKPQSGKPAVMNIITGNVVVKFDGSCMSKKESLPGGGERVIISFNQSGSLSEPPLRKYISSLKKSFFPGLMINIKIPLSGSTVPLQQS